MASRVGLEDVLAALNALNADYWKPSIGLVNTNTSLEDIGMLLTKIESSLAEGFCEMRAGFDSIDRQIVEIKELLLAQATNR